jgi:hypothetical protein
VRFTVVPFREVDRAAELNHRPVWNPWEIC